MNFHRLPATPMSKAALPVTEADLNKMLDEQLPSCIKVTNHGLATCGAVVQGRKAKFPVITPKGYYEVDSSELPLSTNPNVSNDVLPACSCYDCGNLRRFRSYYDAFLSVDSEETDGQTLLVFDLGGGFVLKLPISTQHKYLYEMDLGDGKVHQFSNFNKVLNRLSKIKGSMRKVKIRLYSRRERLDIDQDPIMFIRVKTDHADNLVLCMYSNYLGIRFMIPVHMLLTALRAFNSTSKSINNNYAHQLLRGPKHLLGTTQSGYKYPTFPSMEPFLDMHKASPRLEGLISAALFVLPTTLTDLISSYIGGYDGGSVAVSGPYQTSSLRVLFNSPLFTSDVMDNIALFLDCPRNCVDQANQYGS